MPIAVAVVRTYAYACGVNFNNLINYDPNQPSSHKKNPKPKITFQLQGFSYALNTMDSISLALI